LWTVSRRETADADCASDDFGRHSDGRRCAGANFRGSGKHEAVASATDSKAGSLGISTSPKQIGLPNFAERGAILADNPQTRDKIELGKKLFFEGPLSADGTVACSTYRNPASAFGDDRPGSIGIKGLAGQTKLA
jgi:cytochrome c peroxidase